MQHDEDDTVAASDPAPTGTDEAADSLLKVCMAAVGRNVQDQLQWSGERVADVSVEELQRAVASSVDSAVGDAASQRVMIAATGVSEVPIYPPGPIVESLLPPSVVNEPPLPPLPMDSFNTPYDSTVDKEMIITLQAWTTGRLRIAQDLANFIARITNERVIVGGSASYYIPVPEQDIDLQLVIPRENNYREVIAKAGLLITFATTFTLTAGHDHRADTLYFTLMHPNNDYEIDFDLSYDNLELDSRCFASAHNLRYILLSREKKSPGFITVIHVF